MCRQLAHIWCIWWRLKTSSSGRSHGLIYFKRRFHPVMLEMEAAI
ncbi:4-hydroxyphenylacetate 3-monooxygenase, reductase component [Escherichia coli]|uniref:4-hydroxyphenylacetate 3-monooxygenase, reductase component n=1 Tax=Escherichia coli TaxID=562 RepID=A0A377APT3_ECOLX|nr:4-hydroxyphenylacetate 3-monooxygenase, reductase component [Escherichia coli]